MYENFNWHGMQYVWKTELETWWRVFHTFVGQPQEEGMMRTAASFPSERNQGLSNQEEPRSTLKVDGGGM